MKWLNLITLIALVVVLLVTMTNWIAGEPAGWSVWLMAVAFLVFAIVDGVDYARSYWAKPPR